MDCRTFIQLVKSKYGLVPAKLSAAGDQLAFRLHPRQDAFLTFLPTGQVDAQCGSFASAIRDLPGFGSAFFHQSDPHWVGFSLENVGRNAVENIIDYAFKLAVSGQSTVNPQQYVLLPANQNVDSHYQPQQIPQKRPHPQPTHKPVVPPEIEQMLVKYDYSLLPGERRDKNFYVQGMMMADYTDDYADAVPLKRYYPTYHDLSVAQLRTYFTWRTRLRQGQFTKVADSYAYIYIYELLNNIGVATPKEGLYHLRDFADRFAAQFGTRMTEYLARWQKDYLLYYQLDHQAAGHVFAKEIAADQDFHILLHPADYDDQALLDVFARHATYLNHCRLYQKSPAPFARLLKAVWQAVLSLPDQAGQQYFDHQVASQQMKSGYFFANAVFYYRPRSAMTEYQIDSVRKYRFKGRQYYCWSLVPNAKEAQNLNAFLHEVDRLARLRFHLGHPLKPRFLPAAILKAIDQGIIHYQQDQQRARRPQVKIDLSDLNRIRHDADTTQERLMTDEERAQPADDQLLEEPPVGQPQPSVSQPPKKDSTVNNPQPAPVTPPTESADSTGNLSADQAYFIRALLTGADWHGYLKKHHLMASILADEINTALFDQFADEVIEFNQDDQPAIIEDYRTDLEKLFLDKEEH